MPDKIVNLGGTIENFPKVPVVPDLPSGGGVVAGKASFDELFSRGLDSVKSKGVADIPLSSFYIGNRFTETRPGTDYEEMVGQQQSSADKIGNDIVKFAGVAATSFVSGTAGLVYGIGAAWNDQRFSSLFDNDITRGMDSSMKELEDVAPNYYTNQEKDADWWSSNNLLTANFWGDKVLKNLGYSLGALGGGVAWAKLLKNIGAINGLVKAGKGLEAATAVESAMTNVPKLQKYAAFDNALNSIAQNYIKTPISSVLKDSERILTSVMGTFGEAGMEGMQNLNQFRDKAIQEYTDRNGSAPTGQALKEINDYAEKIGNYTWGMNTLLLSATNYIQLPKILGSSKKADKALINEVESKGLGKEFTSALPTTKFGKLIEGSKNVAGLFFSGSEAFEEGAQAAIQTGVNNYFDRGYKKKKEVGAFLQTLNETMGNILGEGVDTTLSTKEGLESILIGGISGGLQQAGFAGTYTDKDGKTKFGIGKSGEIGERGFFGTGGEKKENTDAALTALNKTNITKALKDATKFLGIGMESQEMRQQAIKSNDTLSEKDYEQDFVLSYVMPRAKYGKIGSVTQELNYYASQANDPQGFDQLVATGIANQKETREEFQQRIVSLKEVANNVDKLYSTINDKYSNVVNKEGEKLYSDDVVDKMVYAASKIEGYDARIPSVNSTLLKAGIITTDVIQSVIDEGVPSTEKTEEAIAQIDAMKTVTSTVREDLKENLRDLIELALRRKQFIDQYDDIKNGPDKYKDVDEDDKELKDDAKEKEIVTIKTKFGEQELEIGTEYYLGKVVSKDKFGNDVYHSERLTIIGENEDGTIKYRDSDGNIKDVEKSVLTSYNLGKVSETDKNEKAKFYMDHWNVIYEHKGIKNKNGKPVKGRLRWNPKTSTLSFTYINDRNQERTVDVRSSQFVANTKKGYKEPMVKATGTLTAVQQTSFNAFVNKEETKEDVRESLVKRKEVVAELVTESKEKLKEVDKLLENSKKELAKQKERLENVHLTKKGTIRKRTSTLATTIKTLSNKIDSLEKSISILEDDKEALESNIPYLQDLLDSVENLPENYEDVIEDLKSDITDLEDMIDNTKESITKTKSLLSSVKDLLQTAISVFDDWVKRVKEENPKIPISIEALQERLEKFYGEEGAKNIINEKTGYAEDVLDLQEQMDIFADELNIPKNTKESDDLVAELSKLETELNSLIEQQIAKSKMLNAFEGKVREYEQQKKEEELLQGSKKFVNKILGTLDKSGQRNIETDDDYEPDRHKSNTQVVTGSVPSQKIPGYKNSVKFGIDLESFPNRENIRGIYVTLENEEELGLSGLMKHLAQGNDKVDLSNIIAFVMFEKGADGVTRLVGIDGKPLTVAPTFENTIYQVMPDEQLTWSEEFGGKTMFRKGTSDKEVIFLKQKYKNWRDGIIKNHDLTEYKIDASFGVPEYVGSVLEDETFERDFTAATSIEDAGLISNEDLSKRKLIEIPTTGEDLFLGSTSFKDALGRVFLSLKNAYVRLNNRKFTDNEANTIYQAIERLADNFFKHAETETEESSNERSRLLTWLKSVAYWGTPKDAKGNRKTAGLNSIWFDSVATDDPIFKSQLRLFFGKNEESIAFTPSNIRDNKPFIIALLKEMYNNANSTMVKGGKTTNWNESYEEIISISSTGEITSREWKNYQSYLLANKFIAADKNNPDNGKARSNNEIPFFTQIRPLKDKEDVNRKSVFFTRKEVGDEFNIPVTPTKSKRSLLPGALSTKETAPSKKAAPAKKAAAPATKGKYVLDGRTPNTFVSAGGKKIGFYANLKLLLDIRTPKDLIDSRAIEILGGQDAAEVRDALLKATNGNKEKVKADMLATIFNDLRPQITEKREVLDSFYNADEQRVTADDIASLDRIERANIFNRGKKKVTQKIEKEEEIDEEDLDESPFMESAPGEEEAVEEEADDDALDITARLKAKRKGNSNLRVKLQDQLNNFEKEDWTKFEKWLKSKFPNVPVYRVKNMIKGFGIQAFGMFHDGGIYIAENAEIGTAYHEVFHAIWKGFTDAKERNNIFNEFRSREGSFVDRPTGETIKYSNATFNQMEEELAEEFREYILTNKLPAKAVDNRNSIVKFFSQLWAFIKDFITGKNSKNNIDELFKNIGSGYYADKYSPYAGELAYATRGIIDVDNVYANESSKLRKAFTNNNIHDTMQEMTYVTLVDLIKTNEGVFNVSKINKKELYKKLKYHVEDIALEAAREYKDMVAEQPDEKSKEEMRKAVAPYIADSILLWKNIRENWEELVIKHGEYLSSYSIEFDENDDIALNDENKSREDPFGDSRKIDNFRKMNSAIKLVLGTLPIVDENGDTELSSINGHKLIPMSEAYIKVMNKVYTSRNPNEMMNRLWLLAKDDLNYRRLFTRITGNADFDTDTLKLNGLTERHQIQLINSFWRTFKKQNPDVKNTFIFENGDTEIGDSNFATAARQIRIDYETNLRKVIKKGSRYFVKKDNVYIGKKGEKINLSNAIDQSNFLRSIGISFTKAEIENIPTDKKTTFNNAVSGIRDSIIGADKIATINGKVLEIEGRLMSLSLVRAAIDNPEFDSTFFNVTGERTQAFIGTNAASDFYDFISQIDSLNDLKGTQYEYILTDSFAQGSHIIQSMFDVDSEGKGRIEDSEQLMKPGYADGVIDMGKGKKKSSNKLTYQERLVQELNLNLKGFYLTLVPGDSSIEHMEYMGNAISEKSLARGYSQIHRIFRGYLISEINLSRENRPIKEVKGADRSTNDLRFFKDILDEKLYDKIVNDLNTSPEDLYKNNEEEINKAVEDFIKKEAAQYKNVLMDYDIITPGDVDGTFDISNVALAKNTEVSLPDLNRQLNAITANYIINNIELHKLLFSDPYQYADELKRIKNFLSPRQSIIYGSEELNESMNNVWNKGLKEGDIGFTDFTKDQFETVTFDDVLAMDEVLGYKSYEEANGSGIIIQTAYRNFRIRAGEWNDEEERQFRYDIAWEKRDRSEGLTEEEIKKSNLTLSKEEEDILEEGNPQVRSAYTPLKPIVAGNKANGRDYNDIILDKFALYPLSYRIMKELNPSANIIKLYNKMQKENIDYGVFESGRKVGAEKLFTIYDKKTGDFNNAKFTKSQKINIPFSIISIQSEVPSKDDGDATRGSQVTKLITMDYMEAGVPIDFKHNNSKEYSTDRYEAWYGLSEEQREKQSPLYKEIKNNQALLETSTNKAYRNLLKRLGIEEYEENKIKKFKIADFSEIAKTLRNEILKREVNSNISAALEDFLNGKVILEATPAYQQVRNIIYSIADKNVISPKINGGMKVQITSSMLESTRVKPKEITTKDGKKKTVFTSDVLKFYRNKAGERVCEIYLSRWFDSKLSDKELLEYLNTTDEGKEILSGLGFRIPTQKQNSIDSFVVAGFLPTEFGDSVVIPSALVEKAGSDFDIDKLTVYLKNVIIDRFGKPRLIKFLTDANSTVKERYVHWVKENSNRDTRQYVKFLSKQMVSNIKSNFEIELSKIKAKVQNIRKDRADEMYDEMKLRVKEEGLRKTTAQEDYLEELFNMGHTVFFRLGEETQAPFWQLKSEMSFRNIKGPEEIRRYMALAVGLAEDSTIDPEETNRLEALISIYSEELKMMGMKQEIIDEIRTNALSEFRKNKKALTNAINLELSPEFKSLADIYEDAKTENSFEAAQEIASKDGLLSIEEFKKLSKYEQNVKKALENAYIQSSQNLVSSEENFKNLTTANSADQLKGLAQKITKERGLDSFEYSSTKNLISRTFMSRLRHAFISGKYAIGIAAVAQTNHSLNQRQPIYIDISRFNELSADDQFWLTGGTSNPKNAGINFEKYNSIDVNGKKVPTLSMIKNANGEYISDIVSQFIDGYVDISKGPWIMELGASPNVAGTFLFLVKLGVPIDTIGYFMNQPIVRDYLRSVENAGYSWLFIDNLVEQAKEKYKTGVEQPIVIKKIPSESALFENIGKTKFSPKERAEQQFILDEFLKYAKMSSQLFTVTQGTNYDTANLNDPYLIYKKEIQYERAQSTIISSAENLLTNSFVKTLRDNILKLRDAFAEILTSDQPTVRTVMQDVLLPYVDLPDSEFVAIAQKAVTNLFDWAVQTDRKFNQEIENILLSDDNVASQIEDLVNKAKSKKHPLHFNSVIKAITILNDDRSDVNNIKIKNRDNKVYDQNQLIYGFRELKEYLASQNNEHLYDRLVKLSVLQSGLGSSPISFTSLLPYEDFIKMYDQTLSKLDNIANLSDFHSLNIFQRNNWADDAVVPRRKAQLKKFINYGELTYSYNSNMNFGKNGAVKKAIRENTIPQILKLDVRSREANSNTLVYTWEDESISLNERKEMKKIGDYSFMQKGLFQKVMQGTEALTIQDKFGNEQFIYKAINAWGDSYRANEFYNVAKKSVIDNGFIKPKEVDDSKIIPYFTTNSQREIAEKNVSLKTKAVNDGKLIKPKGLPAIKQQNKKNCKG
jgi:hypothetical protein